MTRSIAYVTGTRADFGLMQRTLAAIDAHPATAVTLAVTGAHLSERFGRTIDEIEASALAIGARIPVSIETDSAEHAALANAEFVNGFTAYIREHRPDILLLLGDRWEMLAAALVATVAGIPIAHVCGGERSGTIDDSMRHAISKLAHLHLVAHGDARERLRKMGEEEWRIHIVGTPGLVGILEEATLARETLAERFGLFANRPFALVLFHPVVQDADIAGDQAETVLQAIAREGLQAICLRPNADTGNSAIRKVLDRFASANPGFKIVTHLPRPEYLSLLNTADLLVGNSSSGIIEAASFGIPVVNVGDRQLGRERNDNVVDTPPSAAEVGHAVRTALAIGRRKYENIYGDGRTDRRIADLLAKLPLDRRLLKKTNVY